jgi:hypothetical protein
LLSEAERDALRRKYEALIALCVEREALAAQGVLAIDGAPRAQRSLRLRALVQEFPGAARELDNLDASAMRGRLAALNGPLAADDAAVLMHHFHRLLRAEPVGAGRMARVWRAMQAFSGMPVAALKARMFHCAK